MQLTLNFPEIDIKEVPTDNHCEDSYMQEFEQGDFSHAAIQTRYSAKELLHILLTSTTAGSKIQIEYLEKMGNNIFDIADDIDNEYKEFIRKHNDEIRQRLAYLFKKEDAVDLQKRGFNKAWKYNNAYREMYGGKHFNTISVEDPDHERHDRYLLRRKQHIQYCTSQVLLSTLLDKVTIIKHYTRCTFQEKEFIETIFAMDLKGSYQKDILELILEDYTSSFNRDEFVTLVCSMNITENQRNLIVEWISKTTKLRGEVRDDVLEEIQKRR